MGQAAGTAAALASGRASGAVRGVPFASLRERLVADGAIVDATAAVAVSA
jgi:hypothetical protein